MLIISLLVVPFTVHNEYVRTQSLKIIKEVSALLREDYSTVALNEVAESSLTITLPPAQKLMLSEKYRRIFFHLVDRLQFSFYPKGTRYKAFPAFSIKINDVDYLSCKNWIFDLARKATVYKIEEVILINEKMQKTLQQTVSFTQLGRLCEQKNTVSIYFKF